MDFVFNISKGRGAEFYNRVDTNDPANSALVLAVLALAGIENDTVLVDKDTLAALVSGTTNEVTNGSYARKVLTDADLAAFAPDDPNNQVVLDFTNPVFATIAAGDVWAKLVVGFDPDTTGGTDADIIPITAHDLFDPCTGALGVTPNGNNITVNLPTGFLVVA